MKNNVYLRYEPLNSHIIDCAKPNSRRLDNASSTNKVDNGNYSIHNSIFSNDLRRMFLGETKNRRNKEKRRDSKLFKRGHSKGITLIETISYMVIEHSVNNSVYCAAQRANSGHHKASVRKGFLWRSSWIVYRKKPSQALNIKQPLFGREVA